MPHEATIRNAAKPVRLLRPEGLHEVLLSRRLWQGAEREKMV